MLLGSDWEKRWYQWSSLYRATTDRVKIMQNDTIFLEPVAHVLHQQYEIHLKENIHKMWTHTHNLPACTGRHCYFGMWHKVVLVFHWGQHHWVTPFIRSLHYVSSWWSNVTLAFPPTAFWFSHWLANCILVLCSNMDRQMRSCHGADFFNVCLCCYQGLLSIVWGDVLPARIEEAFVRVWRHRQITNNYIVSDICLDFLRSSPCLWLTCLIRCWDWRR